MGDFEKILFFHVLENSNNFMALFFLGNLQYKFYLQPGKKKKKKKNKHLTLT